MTIDELKELEAKATPGPWQALKTGCECDDPYCNHGNFSYALKHCNIDEISSNDLDFIAVIRNIAPELIALWESAETIKQHAGTSIEAAYDDLGLWLVKIDGERLMVALDELNEKARSLEAK